MSEQETTTEDTTTEAVTEDTGTQEPTAQEATDDEQPDWRKDFDPDKAAERIRKIQSENKNLRDRAKQAEQKAAGVDEKDQQISALEAKTLRLDVALDLGLPRQIADRLKGNTREEMLADAEELMQLLNPPKSTTRKPVEALRGGGEPDVPPEERDLDKLAGRMFRR